MLKKKEEYIALPPNKLGKKLLYFSFSFSFVHNFLIALALTALISTFFLSPVYHLKVSWLYHGPTVLFSIKKYAWTTKIQKFWEIGRISENIDTLLAILSESFLCRSKMSPVDNKRLEVHACSPRPHIVSSFSYTFLQSLFSSYSSSFIPVVPFLCLKVSLFFLSCLSPFFLSVSSKEAFCCCAAFRQSTSSTYVVGFLSR